MTLGIGSSGINPSSPTHSLVIVGGGALASPVITRALSSGYDVTVFTNNPSRLEKAARDTGLVGTRLFFVKTSYAEGKDSEYWSKAFSEMSKRYEAIRVINMRGTPPQGDETYRSVFYDPTVALIQGFELGTRGVRRVLVNCSSMTASIYKFDLVNPYAFWRKEADEAVAHMANETGIPGCTLRFDLVVGRVSASNGTNPNHGASPLNMMYAPVQPILGSPELLTIQPVDEKEAAIAMLSPHIEDGSYRTIDAVGPEALSQERVYQIYSRLLGRVVKTVVVPFSVANWLAKYAAVGQVRYGVDLIKHRADCPRANIQLCHREFETLVGNQLRTLEQIYASMAGPVVHATSPVTSMAKEALHSLVRSAPARRDFVTRVAPHLPRLAMGALRALVR